MLVGMFEAFCGINSTAAQSFLTVFTATDWTLCLTVLLFNYSPTFGEVALMLCWIFSWIESQKSYVWDGIIRADFVLWRETSRTGPLWRKEKILFNLCQSGSVSGYRN